MDYLQTYTICECGVASTNCDISCAGGGPHQTVGAKRQYRNQAAQYSRVAFLPEHSRRHPELRTQIQR